MVAYFYYDQVFSYCSLWLCKSLQYIVMIVIWFDDGTNNARKGKTCGMWILLFQRFTHRIVCRVQHLSTPERLYNYTSTNIWNHLCVASISVSLFATPCLCIVDGWTAQHPSVQEAPQKKGVSWFPRYECNASIQSGHCYLANVSDPTLNFGISKPSIHFRYSVNVSNVWTWIIKTRCWIKLMRNLKTAIDW